MLAKFLDLVFPKNCFSCGKVGNYLCDLCAKKLINLKYSQCCPKCFKINYSGKFCGEFCKKGFYFDQLISYGEYKENLLKKLIIKFKYKFLKELAQILAELLANTFKNHENDFKEAILVPVPIHKKRLNYRGFNQAGILAIELMKHLGNSEKLANTALSENFKIAYCLERAYFTNQQVKLNKIERSENIHQSISVKKEFREIIKDKKILLIDDIATTGNTLNECSKALKGFGVSYVGALVLARRGLGKL